MISTRRQFLSRSVGCATIVAHACSTRSIAGTKTEFGEGFGESELTILSDGNLSLPSRFILSDAINQAEKEAFLSANDLNVSHFEPDCNLALWRTNDRLVLFDVGAGSHFMPSAGQLLSDLESLAIDPSDITDVVFTHAHPDHLWGLLDDFDELAFPEAAFFMHEIEWEYWRDDNTLDKLPEERKSFAVGAKNRLALLEDQINLFAYGDEILPGIEAVDTHGHTPGHTSFALHQGSNSLLVLGDALTHPIISFQKAKWPSGSDQDPEAGRKTRLSLLDRLAADKMQIVGFHLPHPGLGSVEKNGSEYRYVGA